MYICNLDANASLSHNTTQPNAMLNNPFARPRPSFLWFLMPFAMVACKKENPTSPAAPAPPNEEELITTVNIFLVNADSTDQKSLSWSDVDGPGGNAPVIAVDTLTAGVVYTARIEVLDESNPANVKDITEEILEEGAEHQFFFAVSGLGLTISYTDADVNGRPIGLASIWSLSAPGSGSVVVTLRHEPNKDAAGVAAGDITNAGGDTDIEVTFPIVAQ